MSELIRLSELKAARDAIRPGEFVSEVAGDEPAMVLLNATPILIEIAEAALAYEQANKSLAEESHRMRQAWGAPGEQLAYERYCTVGDRLTQCVATYLSALAKVQP